MVCEDNKSNAKIRLVYHVLSFSQVFPDVVVSHYDLVSIPLKYNYGLQYIIY